jgi:hypothetical protein
MSRLWMCKVGIRNHQPAAHTACKQRNAFYPRSASASSFPRLGLCLSFLDCFLFSTRFTGLGVPSTARDAAFTALVALNFFSFFFFGMIAI